MIFNDKLPYNARPTTFRSKISTNVAAGVFTIAGAFNDASITLRPSAAYLISDVTFATNAQEPDFIEGLSDPANPVDPASEITVFIERTVNADKINVHPLRFNLYKRSWLLQMFFDTLQENDSITIRATGIIRQTAGMVLGGINRLDLFFNFTMYEIENRQFIEKYKKCRL